MLDSLKWETLETRRTKVQLTIMYKISKDLIDIPSDKYLEPATTRTRANHNAKYKHIYAKTNVYKFSFFPRTIAPWNALPAEIAEASDLVSFKQRLLTHKI